MANSKLILGVGIGFLLILWALSYLGSGSYLREGFATTSGQATKAATDIPGVQTSITRWGAQADAPPKADIDLSGDLVDAVEKPFASTPIDSVDDYEYNLVFKNESDKALTKAQRDMLMAQYPMDWSGRPPSSAQFQAGLRESFQNASPTVPDDAKPYQSITGSAMQPPDTGAIEAEERKILMTYKPTFPPDPTAYDPEDVNDLVKKIYNAKGLEPEIKQRGDSNVYDIVSTRKVGEKVLFEDEVAGTAPVSAAGTTQPVAVAGEGVARGPSMVSDALAPDRFFEEGVRSTRTNKWDYSAWTPGLERMFSPTNPKSNWY
jgi:hypothetical protein